MMFCFTCVLFLYHSTRTRQKNKKEHSLKRLDLQYCKLTIGKKHSASGLYFLCVAKCLCVHLCACPQNIFKASIDQFNRIVGGANRTWMKIW